MFIFVLSKLKETLRVQMFHIKQFKAMFYKFILHIGKTEWTSQEFFDGSSCDFPCLRNHMVDCSSWLLSIASTMTPADFLCVTALVQRVMSLSFHDTRDYVCFGNEFLKIQFDKNV